MCARTNNELRRMTRRLRIDFEQNIAMNEKEKPKHFWKYAKSRIKNKQSIPTLEKPDGSNAITPEDKANSLNQFFCSVFTRERLNDIPELSEDFSGDIFATTNITPEIVWKKLVNLDPNKSPGPDKWHPQFLRELADVICIPLSILFNKSLTEGAHDTWLKATISAIYKKGQKAFSETIDQWASLLSSIIRDAIVSHMVKLDLISDAQHGFVPGRNCLTQLLICMEDWTLMLERKEAFDVIYTDFSKAFDSVPHQRLQIKLYNIGIRGYVPITKQTL